MDLWVCSTPYINIINLFNIIIILNIIILFNVQHSCFAVIYVDAFFPSYNSNQQWDVYEMRTPVQYINIVIYVFGQYLRYWSGTFKHFSQFQIY